MSFFIYKAFLLGLRMFSSLGACVSIIINPVETAQLRGKIGQIEKLTEQENIFPQRLIRL